MLEVGLNKGWRLHEAPLDWDAAFLSRVEAFEDGWLDCSLPCDVHMPLQAAGRVKDVVTADYCHDAEWIEKRSWWFEKRFEAHFEGAEAVELTLESLDAHADIFLNGTHIGTHISAHYPFQKDVRMWLREGENALVVRVTTGLESVTDADLAEINWAVCTEAPNHRLDRSDMRRAFVRKPQYCVGWDWAPRAVTCGIVKGAYLRAYDSLAIRSVHFVTERADEAEAELTVTVEAERFDPISTSDADVRVELFFGGELCAREEKRDALIVSGLNYFDFSLRLASPKLWWPSGCGDQPLYDVVVTVGEEAYRFRAGVRTLSLSTARQADGGREFQLSVNGRPIFCKGGDWIPADSIYARVTREKYERLIDEAKNANFNMLRVWGGGLYEPDCFYELCDERGILLWHDFMLGCSAYPDHLEWFRREVEREADYQTRRLRSHPCMALWCGNNENHGIYDPAVYPEWGVDMRYGRQYGLHVCNVEIHAIVRANCREIPYWNSSPYGGKRTSDGDCGDTHNWAASMMNEDMRNRIEPKVYDAFQSRFVTEYGYPGPCALDTIREYFDGKPIDRESAVWSLHNNTFEKGTVNAGIEKHYGVDASALSLEEYLLYAGMTQSLMLEYSLEAIRFKQSCAGALFWMYNDAWGEVGWTIVDYALRRKIAYYGVKRAFAPVKLTLRLADGEAVLSCCNDTPFDVILDQAKVGWIALDGSETALDDVCLTLPARSRRCERRFPCDLREDRRQVFAVLSGREDIAPAVLRTRDLPEQTLPGAKPIELERRREGDRLVVRLTANGFVHGVYAPESARASDNYFDLLPGTVRTVDIAADGEEFVWKSIY